MIDSQDPNIRGIFWANFCLFLPSTLDIYRVCFKKNLLSWFEVVCIYIYTCSITKTNFVKKGHKNVIISFGMTICTYLILLSLN